VKAIAAALLLLHAAVLAAGPASAASPADAPPVDVAAQEAGALFAATLADTAGRPFALAGLRGRVLVVNFWARWCEPCRREIPELVRAQRRHGDVTVVGIGLEDQAEAVRDFASAYEMDYTLLLAGDQGLPLLAALGNAAAGLPYTLVVDREGRIVARKLGGMRRADIERALRRASSRR
jgi:thiol-disulfide isomerase/thioredoxin